ncbi:MAG: thioredoxin family protein [Deferribacteres bacterium]|nr:thioredoxin family protein [candidate division KSB1 bacterium]MCB9503538.1 thioredoxin family protein [Deferribacteres bacterium]
MKSTSSGQIKLNQLKQYSLMLFYRVENMESQATRIAINEAIQQFDLHKKVIIEEVEYDRENELCKRYNIYGIPTLLTFVNRNLVEKFYGQIQKTDIEKIIRDLIHD